MGQVFVKASRRAKAYTRRQGVAMLRFTSMNRANRPLSALRTLKAASKFIARGHGIGGVSRALRDAAKMDRVHIQAVVSAKRMRGFRKSAYR